MQKGHVGGQVVIIYHYFQIRFTGIKNSHKHFSISIILPGILQELPYS